VGRKVKILTILRFPFYEVLPNIDSIVLTRTGEKYAFKRVGDPKSAYYRGIHVPYGYILLKNI
jgi:hypothetical protein